MYMYGEFLAKMFPFGLYVLLYIMVVRISVDFITKKMFLIEAVFMLICCCALLEVHFKYVKSLHSGHVGPSGRRLTPVSVA